MRTDYHSTHCHLLLQVKNMPPSVTGRSWHSISTFAVGQNCAWLMVIGDDRDLPNVVLLELSEWHNETNTSPQCWWCVGCNACFYLILCCSSSSDTHTHVYVGTYSTLFACHWMYSKLSNSNLLTDWAESVKALSAQSWALRLDCAGQLYTLTCNELVWCNCAPVHW